MVKNLPFNAGDVGSIPGQGTEISCALEQLSQHTTTRDPVPQGRFHMLQLRPDAAR